jgi:hypothetical protein
LTDESKLGEVCKKAEDLLEFPKLLLEYFVAMQKGGKLVKWAVERDVNGTSKHLDSSKLQK